MKVWSRFVGFSGYWNIVATSGSTWQTCLPDCMIILCVSELLPVIGLDNLGNTCYLNSLIQAVVCIPEFLVWLENSRGGVTSSPVSHGRAVLGQPGLGSARLRFRKYGLSSTQKHVRKFFHALVRLVQGNTAPFTEYIVEPFCYSVGSQVAGWWRVFRCIFLDKCHVWWYGRRYTLLSTGMLECIQFMGGL